MAQHGSQIVAALEGLWTAIRERHPDVPEVVVVTGSAHQQLGSRRGGARTQGHFGGDMWAQGSGVRVAEMFVAGELLDPRRDARAATEALLETMLHEAAHGLAHTRGIQDTSRQARYHNRRFAALARELGLIPPDQPSAIGFSDCRLPPATAERYSAALLVLEVQLAPTAYLPDPWIRSAADPDGGQADEPDAAADGDEGQAQGDAETGRSGKRVAVSCGCERRLQVTPKQLAEAPIVCGRCRQEFAPVGADEGQDQGAADVDGLVASGAAAG